MAKELHKYTRLTICQSWKHHHNQLAWAWLRGVVSTWAFATSKIDLDGKAMFVGSCKLKDDIFEPWN